MDFGPLSSEGILFSPTHNCRISSKAPTIVKIGRKGKMGQIDPTYLLLRLEYDHFHYKLWRNKGKWRWMIILSHKNWLTHCKLRRSRWKIKFWKIQEKRFYVWSGRMCGNICLRILCGIPEIQHRKWEHLLIFGQHLLSIAYVSLHAKEEQKKGLDYCQLPWDRMDFLLFLS